MTVTTSSPLSLRACRELAHRLISADEPTNALWAIDDPDPTSAPTLVCGFDAAEDLLGLDLRGAHAVALVAQCRVSGEQGYSALVQSSCGCAAVAVRTNHDARIISGDSFDGFLSDLLRRTLGLPTMPEDRSPAEAVAAAWLTAVLDAVADPATAVYVRSWADVVAMHPFVDFTGLSHVGLAAEEAIDPELDVTVDVIARLCGELDWERLRHLVASDAEPCSGLRSCEAAWMDTAMFARWTLGCYRDVEELLDDCALFISDELIERLQCALARCAQ